PSALTKVAPPAIKGTASGIYSSAQFIGIFLGGTVGGIAMQEGGPSAVIMLVLTLTLIWAGTQVALHRVVASQNA
ncbi:MAG: hypothetical protein P8X50_03080, partial [Maritimibacter sp.]